jgi:hypothetical protein
MRRCLSLIIVGCLVSTRCAFGDDAASAKPGPTQVAAPADQPVVAKAASSGPQKTEEAKLPKVVQEALDRQAQEIKALKE